MDAAFLAMQVAEYDDDLVDEDICDLTATAAALAAGAEAACLLRSEQRKPSRNYLIQSNLSPNPRLGTAWRYLFESQND